MKDDLKVKGIVHCHTTLSYDGEVELRDLCSMLRERGYGFVALTEHPRGLSAEDCDRFVRQCQELSDENFVAIPGVEFLCEGGVEIAGIGVTQLLDSKAPDEVVSRIRRLGGFAIWVHPWRKGRWSGPSLDCDAVEVLNLKVDGPMAPNLGLLRRTARERRAGSNRYATVGVDFHDVSQPFTAWVECTVPEMTAAAIIEALKDGRFVNRVSRVKISNSGATSAFDYGQIVLLRFAFLLWSGLLRSLPDSVRKRLVALSRPIVGLMKGDSARPPKSSAPPMPGNEKH